MKYPITPAYILAAPAPIERYYRNLEAWILRDICSRLRLAGDVTETALEHIRNLKRRGYDQKDIEEYIRKTLKLSRKEFNKIMQNAITANNVYYHNVIGDAFNVAAMQAEIDAIVAQCAGNLDNITRSMGFSVNVGGQRVFLPVARAYQQILSNAEVRVWTGAQSYSEAIRDAVRELSASGLQTVTWANEGGVYHRDHVDVAARRAIMTGITQISSKYSEQAREDVPTEYMEITAHAGARDVDMPGRPWSNHKKWQGKVYATKSGMKYPNVYDVCGWGQVDGLEGANCRHLHYPFWDGISERTYTDEELQNLDPPPFEFEGKTYNAYQATQMQRWIERTLRKTKRDLLAYGAAGDAEAYKKAALRYVTLTDQYARFCEVSGLTPTERGNIQEFGPNEGRKAINAIK